MLILVIGSSVRFSRYREIGLYNKLTAWPQSFKLKLTLQWTNLALVIAQIIFYFASTDTGFNMREFALILQLFVWGISIMLIRFEFRRALGHVWYMHPILWWYSTVYYVCILCLELKEKQLSKITLFVLLLLQVCATLVLAVLSYLYPRDISLKELNYVHIDSVDELNIQLLPEDSFKFNSDDLENQ